MNDAYGSSGSFGTLVGWKYIEHNTYTGIFKNYIKNQLQYTDQFINTIWIIHTWVVTSVGYHKKLLKKSLIFCIRNLVMLPWKLIQLLMNLVPTK